MLAIYPVEKQGGAAACEIGQMLFKLMVGIVMAADQVGGSTAQAIGPHRFGGRLRKLGAAGHSQVIITAERQQRLAIRYQ
jgi:hypothetical protein